MGVVPEHMYVQHVCVPTSEPLELALRTVESCPTQGPRQKQQLLLSTEPLLQTLIFIS